MSDPIDPNNSVILPSVQSGYYYVSNAPQVFTFTYSGATRIGGTVQEFADPEEKKPESKGCLCKKCNDFNEYAEPNQEDGTFICYGCRRG